MPNGVRRNETLEGLELGGEPSTPTATSLHTTANLLTPGAPSLKPERGGGIRRMVHIFFLRI